jgi:hypothetical protein
MMDFRRVKPGQYVARYTNRYSIYRSFDATGWQAYDSEQKESDGLVGKYETLNQAKEALSKIRYAERIAARAADNEAEAQRKAEREAKEIAEREERLATTPNLRNTGVFAHVTITRSEALKLIKSLADYADDGETVTMYIRSCEVYGEERPERLDISVGSGGWTIARAQIVDSMIVDYKTEAKTA